MGCCETKNSSNLTEEISKDIKICIEQEDLTRLSQICRLLGTGSLKGFTINNFLFDCFKGIRMNIPTYSLYLNKFKTLKYLHENFKIDYRVVENILNDLELSALQLICTNCSLELLEFYVPIYVNLEFKRLSVGSNVTIDLECHDNSKLQLTYTPVQMACELGHIQILNFVQNYFKTLEAPPVLDIHYIDQTTGENCALIACRSCNFSMIKFLHTICRADFTILNKKEESAIQILASSGKSSYQEDLFRCLEYLIEQVGVNFLYCYEETLLILENIECIAYIERKLALNSIFTSKTELEYHNRLIKRNSSDINLKEILIDKSSHPSTIEPATILFNSLAEVIELFKNN